MAVLVFIIGTIMGSFYLVIGTRLPKGENITTSRSKCDKCGSTLKWYNLIPLISFIIQGGKCSVCKEKIKSEHFWVELFTGLLFLFTYIYFFPGLNFWLGLIIVSLLIIIFVSDFKYMVILDEALLVGGVLSIILKFIYLGFSKTLYSILSGISLFCVMLLIEKLGKLLLKKDSLGGGDIKFAFLMGFFLDFKLGMVALVLSTFLALPYAVASLYLKNIHEFPYGPFLAGALFIVFFNYDKFTLFINYFLPI